MHTEPARSSTRRLARWNSELRLVDVSTRIEVMRGPYAWSADISSRGKEHFEIGEIHYSNPVYVSLEYAKTIQVLLVEVYHVPIRWRNHVESQTFAPRTTTVCRATQSAAGDSLGADQHTVAWWCFRGGAGEVGHCEKWTLDEAWYMVDMGCYSYSYSFLRLQM